MRRLIPLSCLCIQYWRQEEPLSTSPACWLTHFISFTSQLVSSLHANLGYLFKFLRCQTNLLTQKMMAVRYYIPEHKNPQYKGNSWWITGCSARPSSSLPFEERLRALCLNRPGISAQSPSQSFLSHSLPWYSLRTEHQLWSPCSGPLPFLPGSCGNSSPVNSSPLLLQQAWEIP